MSQNFLLMWNEIKKKGIVVYTTNAKGRFVFSIPEGTASLVAMRLINMMQWINDEFMSDSSTHPIVLQSDNFSEREAFVTRNTSRVLSYVNHVCSLEYILVKLYEETTSKLHVIDSSIVSDAAAMTSRKAEVTDCFTFRNKVSAHTAYGSPKREDNLAMEFHSLVALLSSSYNGGGNANSFALGAISVRLAGEEPSTKLPCLGLKDLHPKMLEHIEKWTEMLIDPCETARQKLPVTIGDTEYKVE